MLLFMGYTLGHMVFWYSYGHKQGILGTWLTSRVPRVLVMDLGLAEAKCCFLHFRSIVGFMVFCIVSAFSQTAKTC
jgi:hypothetical protein